MPNAAILASSHDLQEERKNTVEYRQKDAVSVPQSDDQ